MSPLAPRRNVPVACATHVSADYDWTPPKGRERYPTISGGQRNDLTSIVRPCSPPNNFFPLNEGEPATRMSRQDSLNYGVFDDAVSSCPRSVTTIHVNKAFREPPGRHSVLQ